MVPLVEYWALYNKKYDNHQSDDECLSYIASQLTSDESEAMTSLSKYSYNCHMWVSQEIINRMEASDQTPEPNIRRNEDSHDDDQEVEELTTKLKSMTCK